MRIIAGQFKSRRLKGAPPSGIRPTSDKLRETVFNILGSRVGGSRFLDGFAGVGAIGIEALSRGAADVYFVDQSRKACRMIRENLESLDVKEGYRILEMDLGRALDVCSRAGAKFDIVFLDPPYDQKNLYDSSLSLISAKGLLAPGGIAVLEHSKRLDLPDRAARLKKTRSLVQGDAALAFYEPEDS